MVGKSLLATHTPGASRPAVSRPCTSKVVHVDSVLVSISEKLRMVPAFLIDTRIRLRRLVSLHPPVRQDACIRMAQSMLHQHIDAS